MLAWTTDTGNPHKYFCAASDDLRNVHAGRLRDVFARLSIEPYDLSIDKLAVMADGGTFQRFDKFNLKYNPCGDSLLRTVFLKVIPTPSHFTSFGPPPFLR